MFFFRKNLKTKLFWLSIVLVVFVVIYMIFLLNRERSCALKAKIKEYQVGLNINTYIKEGYVNALVEINNYSLRSYGFSFKFFIIGDDGVSMHRISQSMEWLNISRFGKQFFWVSFKYPYLNYSLNDAKIEYVNELKNKNIIVVINDCDTIFVETKGVYKQVKYFYDNNYIDSQNVLFYFRDTIIPEPPKFK